MSNYKHFSEQELSSSQRQRFANEVDKGKYQNRESLIAEAIYTQESEQAKNLVKEEFIELFGTFPSDVPLVLLNDNGKQLAGRYLPDSDMCLLYLTQEDKDALDNGKLTQLVQNVAHEYAHALSYKEFHWYRDTQSNGVWGDNVQTGFNSFAHSGEEKVEIGHFLEELFALTVSHEVVVGIYQKQHARTPNLKYTDKSIPIALEIMDTLALNAGIDRRELLRKMMLARTQPADFEQELRKLLEQNGNTYLYDVLLSLPMNALEDYEEQMISAKRKINEFLNRNPNSADTLGKPAQDTLTSLAPDEH